MWGCRKESETLNVPISLTDKDGSVFIQIDTISKSFNAYSLTKITKCHLAGIFNDTIRSAFYLAILTTPYWDSAYHACDTILFPTHYPSHSMLINANIDLTQFTSPYHFQLVGLKETHFKSVSFGAPTIKLTADPISN